MNLPSQLALFLSVLLILALLVRYANVAIPVVGNHSFETLLVGFLILLAASSQRFALPLKSMGACPQSSRVHLGFVQQPLKIRLFHPDGPSQ